jgi:hypothetical protein
MGNEGRELVTAFEPRYTMDGTRRRAVHLYDARGTRQRQNVSLCGRTMHPDTVYLVPVLEEVYEWGVCRNCTRVQGQIEGWE